MIVSVCGLPSDSKVSFPGDLPYRSRRERVMGIEPTLPAWKAGTLPLSYTRETHDPGPFFCDLEGQSGRRDGDGLVLSGLRIIIRRGMGGAGFEPAKAMPPDLQSGPFSHLGIHPFRRRFARRGSGTNSRLPTRRLPRMIRAGGESRTHNRRFTKPVLCRLSYASLGQAMKLPTIPS